MWSQAKEWVVDHCWNIFSLDKWKKRSQTLALLVGVAFFLSVLALLVAVWTHLSWREWSTSGAVVLVPHERVVQINGQHYIPIRMLA